MRATDCLGHYGACWFDCIWVGLRTNIYSSNVQWIDLSPLHCVPSRLNRYCGDIFIRSWHRLLEHTKSFSNSATTIAPDFSNVRSLNAIAWYVYSIANNTNHSNHLLNSNSLIRQMPNSYTSVSYSTIWASTPL